MSSTEAKDIAPLAQEEQQEQLLHEGQQELHEEQALEQEDVSNSEVPEEDSLQLPDSWQPPGLMRTAKPARQGQWLITALMSAVCVLGLLWLLQGALSGPAACCETPSCAELSLCGRTLLQATHPTSSTAQPLVTRRLESRGGRRTWQHAVQRSILS